MWNRSIAAKGFVAIADVLRRDETDTLNTALAGGDFRRSRAGARHLLNNQVVLNLAEDPRLKAIASEVLGVGARPFRATLFEKTPFPTG
jgi:hypothetical protein